MADGVLDDLSGEPWVRTLRDWQHGEISIVSVLWDFFFPERDEKRMADWRSSFGWSKRSINIRELDQKLTAGGLRDVLAAAHELLDSEPAYQKFFQDINLYLEDPMGSPPVGAVYEYTRKCQ